MLVDLPGGWETDPRNPYAAQADKYRESLLATRIGPGMHLGLPEFAIDYLVENGHPLDPMFTKGCLEERMDAIRRHFDEDKPEEYGVCDYPAQVVERWPQLLEDARHFVVLFRELRRDQEQDRGWRWHKNGRYIGTQEPEREHLGDEPKIERVYSFKIVRIGSEA